MRSFSSTDRNNQHTIGMQVDRNIFNMPTLQICTSLVLFSVAKMILLSWWWSCSCWLPSIHRRSEYWWLQLTVTLLSSSDVIASRLLPIHLGRGVAVVVVGCCQDSIGGQRDRLLIFYWDARKVFDPPLPLLRPLPSIEKLQPHEWER